MPTYSNGYIPENLLIRFKTGWNATDGNWHHSLSPGTYAKHLALVARALSRTGRTLAITLGWSAYRPYAAQVLAKQIWGGGAAAPGHSSHGGFWEGKQTLAMDYGNWSWVYQNHGGMDQFFADCRAVGLAPGMIMRSRGYPDEPWHVIDLDPWAAAPAGTGATTFDPNGDDELDATEKLQLSRVHDALVNTQGTFYYKPDALINILREELKPLLDAVRNGDVRYPGTNWNAFQTLANVAREDKATLEAILARPAGGGGVDVDALAAQIRDGLGAEVAAELAKRLAG